MLQHHPVACLQAVAVQKPPHIALPALHLAAAPEEHGRAVGLARHHDGRVGTDDGEAAAGAARLGVGDGQSHPVGAGVAPLRPVEVHVALAIFFKHEAVLGFAQFEFGADVALGHGVALLVYEGAVHRVHHVVGHIAVVAAPLHVAGKAGPLGAGHLFRQVQRGRGFYIALAVENPDRACYFLHMKGAGGTRALQRTAGAGGHLGGSAVAAHFNAVVGAGQAVAQVHAHRQRCATVRAMVFQCVQCSIGLTPDGDLVAQAAHRDGPLLHKIRWANGVPEVIQPAFEQGVNVMGLGGCGGSAHVILQGS